MFERKAPLQQLHSRKGGGLFSRVDLFSRDYDYRISRSGVQVPFFRYAVCHLSHISIPAHKHIRIFTLMSTNEPFSLNKKGGLIQSQPLCNTCFSQYQGSVQAYAQVSMGLYIHNMDMWMYRSLAKKGPLSNIHPPPIIASIFCKGLKFTPKSAHPIDLMWKVFECNMMQG